MRAHEGRGARRWGALALAVVGAIGWLGIGGDVLPTVVAGTGAAAAAGAAVPRTGDGVTWLCRPGLADDPCLYPQAATSVEASGATVSLPAPASSPPAVDCFYVYPTVTASAATSNTGTAVTSAEVAAAVSQASRFSRDCAVWAPTYRQRTSASLAKGLGDDPQADLVSYDSVLAAWRRFLAHDDDGRPVVFIGHSQGAADLIRLLRSQVDGNARLRARMVSAIILGGNVQVPAGRTVGGTFAHIPACTAPRQTGCVIAYSSFSDQPPAGSLFGRPGQGVSLQSDQRTSAGQQVVCTNPAALGSQGSAPLEPYFVSTSGETKGSWVTYPGLYTGACESAGGATWLQVTATTGDPRPVVQPTLGPTWGLHLDDVNLALGNLVDDVATEEAAYLSAHRGSSSLRGRSGTPAA